MPGHVAAAYPDHVWAIDFLQHQTHDGRPVRILTITDEHTREALATPTRRAAPATWSRFAAPRRSRSLRPTPSSSSWRRRRQHFTTSATSHPQSAAIAVSTAKRYLPNPQQRIRLHDLLFDEVARVEETPTPLSGDRDQYLALVASHEHACDTLAHLMATVAYWAAPDQIPLLDGVLDRLVDHCCFPLLNVTAVQGCHLGGRELLSRGVHEVDRGSVYEVWFEEVGACLARKDVGVCEVHGRRLVADLSIGLVWDQRAIGDRVYLGTLGDVEALEVCLREDVVVLQLLELDVLASAPVSCVAKPPVWVATMAMLSVSQKA
jgi:hypothetical protein